MPLLLSGNSNRALASKISTKLKKSDFSVVGADITKFSDGEIRVEVKKHVRGEDVYIIQSTCAPANDTLMELLLMVDAVKRAACKRVVAVIPYFGYARQDRRPGYSRVPISAKVVAEMLEVSGVDHVVMVDVHATQIQGFFSVPVDNISATQLFVADIYRKWMDENPIVVSPDVGGVARARELAKHLNNMELAIVDKRRPKANVAEVMNIIGDVRGKTCIVIDDMVDTAGTLAKSADALVDVGGAKRVVAYATHGVLSGKANENITKSKLEQLVITDTIPLTAELLKNPKISALTTANILSEAIYCIQNNKSISAILD